MAEVKIGNWYTYCCQKDLARIETQEDIDTINDLIADDFGVDIYETQLEALQDIRESWIRSLALNGGSNPEDYQGEIDECDEMIRGLTQRAPDRLWRRWAARLGSLIVSLGESLVIFGGR